MSPESFRELRHGCLLSRKACAAYLGVSLRTVRHWDAGRNRVPWSVVRLLRVLRMGDLGALHDEWTGWTINRLGLHAPAGRTYRERDMRLWWMTSEQARFWRQSFDLPTRFGAAQPRERLEGASTFPREEVGQGEKRTRETELPVSRQERPSAAEPASSTLQSGEKAPMPPAASMRLGRTSRQVPVKHVPELA